MRWIPFPFVRIASFLIAGIVLGIYQADLLTEFQAASLGVVLLLLFLILVIFFRSSSELLRGSIALMTVFAAGYFRSINHNQSKEKNHILHVNGPITLFYVQISNQPSKGHSSIKAEADLVKVMVEGQWQNATGKIQLLMIGASKVDTYRYGDILIIKGSPQPVKPPSNPGEFDYKRYLSFKNIYHQRIVKPEDVGLIKRNQGYSIFEWSYAARDWGNDVLHKYITGTREYAIATALILGVTDELDWDILNAYSSTGVLHVLSVSGLHVGIVYMILLFLCKPLENHKAGKWVIAIISILVLWAYAFITGLSPSVLRSVTMFSFVALTRPINMKSNIYNTLSLSALILLLCDPYMIMSAGFQLSYLALIGIVYFQPRIYKQWEPQSVWVDKIWEVSSVSLAAQLITFPVSLLYFHQFPTYFLFANLLVIPASFVVLVGGLALLAFQFINPLAYMLGLALEFVIKWMNAFIVAVDEMPFSSLNNVSITQFQFWILMGILTAIALLFRFRRFSFVITTALLSVIFCVIQWDQHANFYDRRKITIYNIPHQTAMDLFDHGKAHYLFDSALCCDPKRVSYSIKPNRVMYGISQSSDIKALPFTKSISGARVILWRGKYFLQIMNSAFKVPLNLPVFDYCIISNNAVKDMEILKGELKFKKLIIDSSNSFYVADHLLKRCKVNKINAYSVLHSGAYEEFI